MKKLSSRQAAVLVGAIMAVAGGVLFAQERRVVVKEEPAPAAPEKVAGGAAGEPGEAPKPKVTTQPGNPGDGDSTAQIYVDESFGSVDKLRTALRYARQERSSEAITLFQEIVNEFGEKLVYLNNDSYTSVTDYVRDQLLKMPAVNEGMYDTLFNGAAGKAVDAATEKRDLAELVRTCDRYYPASAALGGLAQASDWYFERGEFSSAARGWKLLLAHPRASAAQKAEFLHHAIVAEKLAGRVESAKRLRDRLAKEYENAEGTVAGAKVKLLDNADAVLAEAAWEVQGLAPGEWPTYGGNAAHDGRLDVNAGAGARLWSASMEDPPIGAGKPAVTRANPYAGRRGFGPAYGNPGEDMANPMLECMPVMSGGSIFVHTGERVAALSANAGTILWTYPAKLVSGVDPSAQPMYNPYGRMMRTGTLDAASVFENQLYAVLPATAVALPPRATGRFGYYGVQNTAQTRMVALDRLDGKEIWSTAASSIELKTGGGGFLAFMGTPVVTRQGVFVMARKTGGEAFTPLYLVRLDRETGRVMWTCYLCSAASFGYGMPSPPSSIVIPTLVDDVVYISTGQGADCAVDGNAGRILWLQVTESGKTKPKTNMMYYQPNMESTPAWKANAPLVYRDKLVAAEVKGNLRVYDRWTGKLLRSTEPDKLGKFEVLAGFAGSNLILVGPTGIMALDVETDKRAWVAQAPDEAMKLAGRPFLAEKILYVPYVRGLLLIDAVKGTQINYVNWPQNEKEAPGKPGNLLVTGEQIVVASDKEVTGYSKWETARDNRLARIKAEPGNPEPCLALAEVAFRTNHLDMAEEYMSKAVGLLAQRGDDELRQRTYRTNLNFAEQLLGKSDVSLRDQSRFYYEQCKLTAKSPESQAEWRLSMSDLAMAQKKWGEAAELYSALLGDSGMRGMSYRKGEALAQAGVMAEQRLRGLIEQAGRSVDPTGAPEAVEAAGRAMVYKPFEALAAGALAKARAESGATRIATLTAVTENYPNSLAALTAATDVAALRRDSGNWNEAVRMLRWLYPRASGNVKAQATADLATAQAAQARWNTALAWADRGAREFGGVMVSQGGRSMSFTALRDALRAKIPAMYEGRRPTFPEPRLTSGDSHPQLVMRSKTMADQGKDYVPPLLAEGLLLPPVEQGAAYRRADGFFVLRQDLVRMFDAKSHKEKWAGGVKVPLETTMHLGCYGEIAVFVQNDLVFGVDTAAGKLKWQAGLSMDENERMRLREMAQRIRAAAMQDAQMRGLPMVYEQELEGYTSAGSSSVALVQDPDVGRNLLFARGLGEPKFSTMRMVGNKLLVVSGAQLRAFDLATGEPAWKDASGKPVDAVTLPAGLPTAILGNDESVVVQVDSERGMAQFAVLDLATGRTRGVIKLEDERAQWRGLSDEGVLYVVTDRGVCAFDCQNLGADAKRVLWRRDDIKVKYPGATAITIDGLVVVKDPNQLVSLSLDGGETRWMSDLMVSTSANNMPAGYLRSMVEWDQIIYQTERGIAAQYTSDGKESWTSKAQDIPPIVGSQMADRYMFSLSRNIPGMPGSSSDVVFLAHDRQPGHGKHLKISPRWGASGSGSTAQGNVRQWQVVDNMILLEVQIGNAVQVRALEAETNPEAAAPRKP